MIYAAIIMIVIAGLAFFFYRNGKQKTELRQAEKSNEILRKQRDNDVSSYGDAKRVLRDKDK